MKEQKSNQVNRKKDISILMLFAGVFFVVIFFSWYFLIFVEKKEKAMTKKSFRVLTQMAKNFEERDNSFRKMFKAYEKNFTSKIKNLSESEIENNIFGVEWEYIKDSDIEKLYSNKEYFYFSKNNEVLRFQLSSGQTIIFKIKKERFFEPLIRKDIFDEIIVVKKDSSKNKPGNYEYSSFNGDIEVKTLDSLVSTTKALVAGIIRDIELAGIDYKLYLKPVKLKNNEEYYLCGVINREVFMEQARSINPYITTLLVILFFIFLFSIPLLKLRLISKRGELKLSDLIFSAGAIIFITFFALLIILSMQTHIKRKIDNRNNLETLADTVSNCFINEVKAANSTLAKFIAGEELIKPNNLSKGESSDCDSIRIIQDKSLTDRGIYKYFKYVFRMDNTGQQDIIVSSRKGTVSKDNYSYRNYFKKSGEWVFDSDRIYIEAIVSNTSGEKLGVVSKRDNDYVYATTARLTSVINNILPPGYGFGIINTNGKVLFHSDNNRMLQENFIDETENYVELTNAIYGNKKAHFSTDYLGSRHSVFIKPFEELPLYIFTFYEENFSNSVKVQITFLTIVLTILLLITSFSIVFGARFISSKKTLLKRKYNLASWIRPDRALLDKYFRIAAANIFAFIIMLFMYLNSNETELIFLIFLLVIIQLIFTYIRTHFKNLKQFLKNHFLGTLLPSSLFLFFLFYFANLAGANIEGLLFSGLVLIVIDIIFILIPNYFSNLMNIKYFYCYLCSWILILLVSPLIFFYSIFHNFESKAELNYVLYECGKKYLNRSYQIDEFYDMYINESFKKFKSARKNSGIYSLNEIEIITENSFDKFEVIPDSGLKKIVEEIEFNSDNYSAARKSLIKKIVGNKSSGEKLKIKSVDNRSMLNYSSGVIYPKDSCSTSAISLTGIYSGQWFFSKLNGIVFWFIIILLLWFIVRLIKFTTERLFGTAIDISSIGTQPFDNRSKIIKTSQNIIFNFPSHHDFKPVPLLNFRVLNFSFMNPENKEFIELRGKKYILENFQINTDMPKPDLRRLKYILELIDNQQFQFVIFLKSNINNLISHNEILIAQEKDEIKKVTLTEINSQLTKIQYSFLHINLPVPSEKIDTNKLNNKETGLKHFDVILKELEISKYLSENILQFVLDYAITLEENQSENQEEKIILKIEELAHGYYESLWQSCSDKEKIFLYDLADDLVLNDKNEKVIKRLFNKGLITNTRFFDVMNRSFKNYIIAKFEAEDQYKNLRKLERKGQWTNYRAPITLIILTLAFFIALQENILNNLTSIVTSIIAILGLVTKLSGILPTGFGGSGGGGK